MLGGWSIPLGLLAGVLSTLSPCVLPLLPLIVGSAASAGAGGVWLLAAGLSVSFTAIGLFVATVGFAIGLDGGVFRTLSAVLLGVVGLVLLSSALRGRFAVATGGVADWGSRVLRRLSPRGAWGQLVVGGLLGAVWAPCVGPTLGTASLLAARRQDLGQVTLVMLAFGVGAALPLLLIGSLSRQAVGRWRARLMRAGGTGRAVFGGVAVATSLFVLTGLDRVVESWAVAHSPGWLTTVTTQF